jgi:hypothetical protein
MKTITLANLKDSTAQEVFEFVAQHLLNQNQRCMNNGKCAYRGEDGLKCAVGAIIADDEYDPVFDMVSDSGIQCLVRDKRIKVSDHLELLTMLQSIHDNYPEFQWEDKLKALADRLGIMTEIFE